MPIARVGSIDICYDVRGSGEPILLLMGFASQMILWDEDFCEMLASSGFTVVRMDNRDVGESSKLDHLGVPDINQAVVRGLVGLRVRAPYLLDDMAEDSVGLMRVLGYDRFHVVGASMGGMIGQTIAINHPESLYSLTSIMSSAGGRFDMIGDPRGMMTILKRPPRDKDAQIEHFVEVFRTLSGPGFPLDVERFRPIIAKQIERGLSPRGTARQLAAIAASAPSRRARIGRVRTPTLVIHGTDDPLVPYRAGVATAKAIEGADLLTIRGMGHDLPFLAYPLISGAITTHAKRARLT